MPRTTSAGKKKIGTKLIAFLILLVPLPTKAVLVLVPDLVRLSKQFISYVPQKATGVTDVRWMCKQWANHSGKGHFKNTAEGEFPANSHKFTQIQSPFLAQNKIHVFLQILDSLTTVPEDAKTGVTKGDLSPAESRPHTSYLQGCRTWRRDQTAMP